MYFESEKIVACDPTRRSARVLVTLRVVLSGKRRDGTRFDATGATTVVSKHGARIRTSEPLSENARVRLALISPYRTTYGLVVFADTDAGEYGVELETPGNFWGVCFPPVEWGERSRSGATAGNTGGTPDAVSLGLPQISSAAAPSAGHLAAIPTTAVEAIISGMSSVRLPFQEKGKLYPTAPWEATMLVRPTVDAGTRLRVLVLRDKRVFSARISAVSRRREHGKWRVWIRFS